MREKVRIGLILDNVQSSKMIHDFLEISKCSKHYEVTHLIIQKTQGYTGNIISKSLQYIKKQGLSKFLRHASFKVISNLEFLVIKRLGKFQSFFDTYDLLKFPVQVIEVDPVVSESGFVYRYSKDDLDKIRSQDLKLLVRGGSGILRGDILNVCENGIVSFHHADNNVNRGGPPGFWEVVNKEKRTGFIIQKLKDELDGGDVIFKGYFQTSFMYTMNLIKLYENSNPFLHLVIENLFSDPSSIQVLPKSPYSYPLYKVPTIATQIKYVLSTLSIVLSKIVRRLNGKYYRWGVAYQFVDDWRDVTLWRSKRIPNPPNRFLADPFVIKKDGNHYCFMEDYDYTSKRAHISVYEITKDSCKEIGIALKEDFHLSYPFIFKHENEIYMCPETHDSKEIRIYKCVEFPLRWEISKILMSDVSAVDTNIFFKGGKWWMITNLCTSLKPLFNSEMHVFSSDLLMSDDWHPHPKNPIFIDPLIGRNGGLIVQDDDVYRVFQKQGFDLYGESLGVSKIVKVDMSEYVEEIQFEVDPIFFDRLKGTHTYSFSEGLLAIDFVKIEKIRN